GVSVGTAIDNTYAASTQFALGAVAFGPSSGVTYRVDDIRHADAFVDDYDSEELDLLAAPAGWGTLAILAKLNGWTISLFTNVASIAGGPYDGWVAVDGSSVPQSALKRYAKLRARFTGVGAARVSLPELQRLRLNFTTN